MGVIEVRRINKGVVSLNDLNSIITFPNPTEGPVQIQFKIKEDSEVDVAISDEVGRRVETILKQKMPAGKYKYNTNLDRLPNGFYVLSVTTEKEILHSKIIVQK
jgi:Secretion system C-terminal sorting domain